MEAPAWLEHARRHCWVMCPGGHPLVLSLRYGPVQEDNPEGPWDWGFVAHHPEGCPELEDAAALDDLKWAVLAEVACHILVADYGCPRVDHTAVAAP
jgi:hypothetical protein